MKKLNLSQTDISSVTPEVVGLALARVEELTTGGSLSLEQAGSLLTEVAASENLNLRTFLAESQVFSQISPPLISEAICRLEDCRIQLLTEQQLISLFTRIANCHNLKLKVFKTWASDLSSLPSDILAESIIRLRKIYLPSAKLSPDQVESIFLKISRAESLYLDTLYLSHNDVSTVSPEVLVEAVVRLETVDLSFSGLTTAQLDTILRELEERSGELRLKYLNLHGNVSITMSVRLRARALAKLGLKVRCTPSQYSLLPHCLHILPNNPWLDN